MPPKVLQIVFNRVTCKKFAGVWEPTFVAFGDLFF